MYSISQNSLPYTHNSNINHTQKELSRISSDRNRNRYKSKLYVQDPLVHAEIMAILKEGNFEAYAHTPKELRNLSIVLRYLYHGIALTELLEN